MHTVNAIYCMVNITSLSTICVIAQTRTNAFVISQSQTLSTPPNILRYQVTDFMWPDLFSSFSTPLCLTMYLYCRETMKLDHL